MENRRLTGDVLPIMVAEAIMVADITVAEAIMADIGQVIGHRERQFSLGWRSVRSLHPFRMMTARQSIWMGENTKSVPVCFMSRSMRVMI